MAWCRNCDAFFACVDHAALQESRQAKRVAEVQSCQRVLRGAFGSWAWQVEMLKRGLRLNGESTRIRVQEALETWQKVSLSGR